MKVVFALCFVHFCAGETLLFTNQGIMQYKNYTTYKIDVPGSRPITIFEADSPYSINRRVSVGPISNVDTKSIPLVIQNNTRKLVHSPTLLEKFLETYQKQTEHYEDPAPSAVEAAEMTVDDNEGRKNRPHQGWVSLEPVPTYTSGKVYKWNSSNPPPRPSSYQSHWDSNYGHSPQRPYDEFDDDEGYQVPPKPFGTSYPNKYKPYHKPEYPKPDYQKPDYPKPDYQKPSYHKPTYGRPEYERPDYEKPIYDKPDYPKPFNSYELDDRYSIKKPWNDLITDNRPPNFPDLQPLLNRKKDHPDSYPGHGEGEWVLVSTTKGQTSGHNYQNRQKGRRSMGETASVSTVLHVIPNKNSVNVTTHNGEVIEVAENSRKAKELHAKRKNKRLAMVEQNQDATGPVFAAVGAGLIPATLSLVAPMVLGRRRRNVDQEELFLSETLSMQ